MSTLIRKPIIGVMGPGTNATDREIEHAEKLGGLIAHAGWCVLTGGSSAGVMNAALKGAKEYNPDCVTIGISSKDGRDQSQISKYADYVIPTGMGEGRNFLNIRTSHFIVACCNDLGKSPGTSEEFTLAIKYKKPLIGLYSPETTGYSENVYRKMLNIFSEEYKHYQQEITDDPKKVISYISLWLKSM